MAEIIPSKIRFTIMRAMRVASIDLSLFPPLVRYVATHFCCLPSPSLVLSTFTEAELPKISLRSRESESAVRRY